MVGNFIMVGLVERILGRKLNFYKFCGKKYNFFVNSTVDIETETKFP